MPEKGKVTPPAPHSEQRRSRRLRAITCVSGMGAAAVGLLYVLTGNARVIDVVLVAGGLLVTLAGFILMRRRD